MAEYTTADRVRGWLQLTPGNEGEDAIITDCVDAANSVVGRYAGEDVPADGSVPSATDCRVAATMLAARLYRRRNSPEGIQGITPEGVAIGIVRSDADIARLLRIDSYTVPMIG